MHPWEYPKYAWQRLHIDYAGPFLNHSFLIIVDAYSKWPEVIPMQSTNSVSTIRALMQVFATHGLPERIVSDNGPQFASQEFKEFMDINGIRHTFSAPYHPATNGEAERFVQTFKHNMKCRQANSANIRSCISKFLLAYRTTEHAATCVSPSLLLMGRRIRTKLDLMYPRFLSDQEHKGWEQIKHQGKMRNFVPSEEVLISSYNTSNKWIPGKVTRELGNLHYEININGNGNVKRHVDQMRPSVIKQSNDGVTRNDTDEMIPNVESNVESETNVLPERVNRGKPPERLDL